MNTSLLPVRVNNRRRGQDNVPVSCAAFVDDVYSGDAPKAVWNHIAAAADNLVAVETDQFGAYCTEDDVTAVSDLLVEMGNNTVVNAGGDYNFYHNGGKANVWLSMTPSCLVFRRTKHAQAIADWMVEYSLGKYLGTNAGLSIGDQFKMLVKTRDQALAFVNASILTVPSDNDVVYVEPDISAGAKQYVPIWWLTTP